MSRKAAGTLKQYRETATTFTKIGMWQERYWAEVRALELASANGIAVPRIVKHGLDDSGTGYIELERILTPRVDEVVWLKPNTLLIQEMGETIGKIHRIPVRGEVDLSLAKRRFSDLIRDVRSQSNLPEIIYKRADAIFAWALKEMQSERPCFIHGDCSMQNAFALPLVIFDWEHSRISSGIYDVGNFISFALEPVVSGSWSFSDYYEAEKFFCEGYGRQTVDQHRILLEALKFFSHRVIPQFFLFALEYAAIPMGNPMCQKILNGLVSTEDGHQYLKDFGFVFDRPWLEKIISSLNRGGYKPALALWRRFGE